MPESIQNEIVVATISHKGSVKAENISPGKQKKWGQYLATIIVNLSSLAYGTFAGWPSPAIFVLQSDNPPIGDEPITDEEASWIGSLLFLGFLCGTPVYSYIADRFGRKPACLLIALPIIINWILIIFGETVFLILVARFIVGLSIAGVFTVVPIYVGEISEVSIRGTLGTVLSIFANFGVVFAYIVGSYTSYRTFAIVLLIIPILFLVTFMWMPETPIYLLKKGEVKKAKLALKMLRGNVEEEIENEITNMTQLLKEIEERDSGSKILKELLFNKGSRRGLAIGVVVSLTQMFSGVYVILSYNAVIFEMANVDIPPEICSIITGSVLFIAPILSCFLMDRAGRKILLISSLTVMTICQIVLGTYFFFLEYGTDLTSVGFIPVLCLCLYLLSLGLGIGPINMVLFSEIFLPHVRSLSASISTFLMSISAFIVTRFYNDLSSVIGVYGSFWFFACCCILGGVYSVLYIPETKNRTIESIYAELNGNESGILPSTKKYEMTNASLKHEVPIIINLASFANGTYTGWPSPAIFALQSDNPPIGDEPITDEEASWIGSLLFLGFLCGNPVYSYIADRFGRKPACLLIALPIIINWILIIFGETVFLILVARFIVGLSIAGVFTVVPIYVGEISEVSIRGTLGTVLSIFANFGIVFAYIVCSYTSYRTFAIILLIIPILFLVTFMWMPETPIYLLKKGDVKNAKLALKILRGNVEGEIENEITNMTQLLKEIEERDSGSKILKELLFNKGSRRGLAIGVVVSLTQMFSGVYVVLSYNAVIFEMANVDIPPEICSIITGSVLFIAPILSCFLMDRAGRKILLISSLTVMSICQIVLGTYFFFLEYGTDLTSVGFIPVLCLCFYLLSLGLGIGPINMVLLSEIFLPHVRSISASISTFLMAFSSFIVTRFYNDLSSVIGVYGSFWFFACCCILGGIYSVLYIPETKNRTIESIYAELSGNESGILPIRKTYNMTSPTVKSTVPITMN
ncbi:hypothetical protein C0J52_07383 [Blattella germanica]|nr:hypothetical protein C0J52_07383 [Blattella germanica]